jgi:hypothetical protein
MMATTNYFGNEILNYNFIGTAYTPGDANNFLYFGLSTTEVTAQDVSGSTATEPTASSYARKSFYSGYPIAGVTAMSYTSLAVTLTVDNVGQLAIGDIITVTGVDTGFTVTNIDGTWTLTNVAGSDLTFTVASQPVGATPQTISIGNVRCANWSTSTSATLINNKAVTFVQSDVGDPWSTSGTPIVSIFIADDPSTATGDILAFYTLPAPLVIPELTTVSLPAASITISQPTSCGTLFAINRILNYNFGGQTYTPDDGAGNLYLGLSLTVVDNTGLASVTEPAATTTYARQTVPDATWDASTGVNPPSGVNLNTAITFPTVVHSWGRVKSLFLSDSPTRAAGNILWYKTLSPSIVIQEGTEPVFFNGGGGTGDITFKMV